MNEPTDPAHSREETPEQRRIRTRIGRRLLFGGAIGLVCGLGVGALVGIWWPATRPSNRPILARSLRTPGDPSLIAPSRPAKSTTTGCARQLASLAIDDIPMRPGVLAWAFG